MVRLGRWKSGFALLLLLHLLVHPAIHVLRLSELASASTQHTLVRGEVSALDDACSLCRVSNALHAPAPAPSQGQLLLQVGSQSVESVAAPRAVVRSQQIPRAPPSSIHL